MTTPDVFPLLKKGKHASPKDGGCVMEVCSFLAGEEWSDQPACVQPTLAEISRTVNDLLTTDHRQRLINYVNRLINTTHYIDIDDEYRKAYEGDSFNENIVNAVEDVNHYINAFYRPEWNLLDEDAWQDARAIASENLLDAYDAFLTVLEEENGQPTADPITTQQLDQVKELVG